VASAAGAAVSSEQGPRGRGSEPEGIRTKGGDASLDPPARSAVKSTTARAAVLRGAQPPSRESRGDGTARVTVTSEPDGAEICFAEDRRMLGRSGVAIELPSGRRAALLVYLPGYRLARLQLVARDGLERRVTLQPASDDDLEEPNPCR
jgi:hypothetical protein